MSSTHANISRITTSCTTDIYKALACIRDAIHFAPIAPGRKTIVLNHTLLMMTQTQVLEAHVKTMCAEANIPKNLPENDYVNDFIRDSSKTQAESQS